MVGRLRVAVGHRAVAASRPPASRRGPPPLGERRADGHLLLRGRPRDQAGAGHRAAGRPPRCRPSRGGRSRGHGRPRPALRGHHPRRPRRPGVGHPDGDRHRVRAGGPGPAQPPHPTGAQHLAPEPGHRGRHRRRDGHRRLLHRHHRSGLAGRRRRRPGGGRPHAPGTGVVHARLRRRGGGGVDLHAGVGDSRHHRRGGSRPAHTGPAPPATG